MIIKIKKTKRFWIFDVIKDGKLIERWTPVNLDEFAKDIKNKKYISKKTIVYLDTSCYLLFIKEYPVIRKKTIQDDANKSIKRFYKGSMHLFDSKIIRKRNKKVLVGLLIANDLYKFLNFSFRKMKNEHLVKIGYNKKNNKIRNFILLNQNELGLVIDNIFLVKMEINPQKIDDAVDSICYTLYDKLFNGTLYLVQNKTDDSAKKICEHLKSKIEKQVHLIVRES